MSKGRVEAFSDGVLAIIITIMVLELQVPDEGSWTALLPLIPKFLSYILSFIFIGIYWNNHHHLWHTVKHVRGSTLWANMHLLFWLSLIPFATGWMGENHFSTLPVALYGSVLWLSAMAYYIMVLVLIAHHGRDSLLFTAIGNGQKERLSLLLYTIAIPLAFINSWISLALYVTVAVMWLIPDRRIERVVNKNP